MTKTKSIYHGHRFPATFSILCASLAYVRAHGAPKLPSYLAYHECLIWHTPAFPSFLM